ncbi:30S ribosome-binding factor RbfA [Micrococcales bacterium 31B]|nr:30S ribosome-binding factor RbfA [Micrococcales bacterium 31B]
MVDNARARKMADRIKQVVAESLDKRVKDPRLGFITVTDVQMTGDLQHAAIYYTVYGDTKSQEDTAAALRSATGMLRTEVGRSLGVRLTPSLTFHADALPEAAQHMTELLSQAREQDAEVARLAAEATFAGESDPYKKPAAHDAEGE